MQRMPTVYHLTADMSVDIKVTVEELIALPFRLRTAEDRLRIVSEGRPTPPMAMSAVTVAESESSPDVRCCREVSHSGQTMYEQFPWLTASLATGCFYCWPCLLFQVPGLWNETGISDIVLLSESAPEHQKTPEHIEAAFRLQTFFTHNVKKAEVVAAADDVTKNPGALRRLTDVVCSLVALESGSAPGSLGTEKCLRALALLRKYDALDKKSSDEAIRLMKESPGVVDRIARAVARVVRRSIARDVQSSQYVSLILGRHQPDGGVSGQQKVRASWILRYVWSGRVVERFLGFSDIAVGSSPVASIYEHVRGVVSDIGVSSKCVAMSLDGALLPCDQWDDLAWRLRESGAPHCHFLPWHAHPVDSVLQQSLSSGGDPRCGRFFKSMAALQDFFSESPELLAAYKNFSPSDGRRLREIVLSEPDRPAACRRFATANFLSHVRENRRQLVLFFDAVRAGGDASTKWEADDLAKAIGFMECLGDSTTALLLDVFDRIFGLTAALGAALGGDVPERNFGKGLVSDLMIDLDVMRDRGLGTWLATHQIGDLKEGDHIPLFNGIMERVIAEVEARYGMLDNLQFCRLLDFQEEGWFEQSDERIQNLAQCYDMSFNTIQAQSEMELLFRHEAFSMTSVYDFHKFLHDSNLKHTFKSMFDISELILAMPFKRAGEVSVLDKMSRWLSFGTEFASTLEGSSVIFVESDYLLEIKQSSSFYDEVIATLSN